MSRPDEKDEGGVTDGSGLLVIDPGYPRGTGLTLDQVAEITRTSVEDAEKAWQSAIHDCNNEALDEVKLFAAKIQAAAEKFGCPPMRFLAAVRHQLMDDIGDTT